MKILATLIIFFQLTGLSYARTNIRNMTPQQINDFYYKSLDEASDETRIFIPKNTVVCASKEKLNKVRNQAVNTGGQITFSYLNAMGCDSLNGWSIGLADEIDQKNNMLYLFYILPFSDKQVSYGYFDMGTVMTIKQRKEISKNNKINGIIT